MHANNNDTACTVVIYVISTIHAKRHVTRFFDTYSISAVSLFYPDAA